MISTGAFRCRDVTERGLTLQIILVQLHCIEGGGYCWYILVGMTGLRAGRAVDAAPLTAGRSALAIEDILAFAERSTEGKREDRGIKGIGKEFESKTCTRSRFRDSDREAVCEGFAPRQSEVRGSFKAVGPLLRNTHFTCRIDRQVAPLSGLVLTGMGVLSCISALTTYK